MQQPSMLRLSLVICAALAGACSSETTSGGDGGESDGGVDAAPTLEISPATATVAIMPGQPLPTVQYTATRDGQSVPVQWSLDRGEIASISGAGVATPLGQIGGRVVIKATDGQLMAQAELLVNVVTLQNGDPNFGMGGMPGAGGYGGVGGDGPGGTVTTEQQQVLQGTTTTDPTVTWLYPYDATVFPRGMLAPLLMWERGAHAFTSLRLQMTNTSGSFSYDGYFSKPTAATNFINLPIPAQSWHAMNYSSGGEEVTVTVTLAEGTTAIQLAPRKWKIAAGTLHGVVYYNSYGTALAQNSGGGFGNTRFGGATLGIRPGETDPVLISGRTTNDESGCRVCHSVATGGGLLVTQHGDSFGAYGSSVVVDLKNGNIEAEVAAGDGAFPALSPDGAKLFTSSGSSGLFGAATSQLFTMTANGQSALVMNPPGLPAGLKATLPSFSHDGKMLAFNLYAGVAGADTRSLATMTFDPVTNAFGVVTPVFTPATFDATGFANAHAVWPSFLPTSTGIVFQVETNTNEFGYTRGGNRGEMLWVDIASMMAHRLDRLNGVGYLPTSGLHPDDTTLNYEPTVNPVPSGGYAWVVFTSRRMYGNVATMNPFLSDPRDYDWVNQINTKKLWVAAVDLSAAPGADPSHPAFYLPAQELKAGNSRGFWTVDPCRADGEGCETGDECCGGFCQPGGDGGALVCGSQSMGCSMELEFCNVTADCCPPEPNAIGLECIGNRCVRPIP